VIQPKEKERPLPRQANFSDGTNPGGGVASRIRQEKPGVEKR
jgi:hypothetical protein